MGDSGGGFRKRGYSLPRNSGVTEYEPRHIPINQCPQERKASTPSKCLMCPKMCLILTPFGHFLSFPKTRFSHEKPCFFRLKRTPNFWLPPPPLFQLAPSSKFLAGKGRRFIYNLALDFSKFYEAAAEGGVNETVNELEIWKTTR